MSNVKNMRIRLDRSLLLGLGNGLLVCVMTQSPGRALSATPLPTPCLPGTCGTNAGGFVTSGAATAVQSGNNLTVHQSSNTATLNWSSFNIGANGSVTFKQPTSSSIALNRIFDASPTSIFGSLTANGQIYLINANGFLFGSGAKVNVAGMIASSLNLSDATFASGILAPLQSGLPALQSFTDSAGNSLSKPIVIDVGATLSAAPNGRLLIAAPNVTNSGSLNAPDGQIVLAAGQKVYLQASASEDLRGLIVEVDGGGAVANQLSGALSAPRGNITLAGLMVNQDGRVSATTSVAANGSITLVAGNGNPTAGTGTLTPTVGGTVEMGPGSVTEILPEYADTTTAVDAQAQLPSTINITGQQVLMHGASIDAPSGALNVLAAADPATGVSLGGNSQSQIRIDAGTNIDLAGSDADLPMAANLVSVQLRSNEFADDPTQRNGALRGETVFVDVRADGGKGTPIADVSAAIAAVGKTIAQRTEAGGTASFKSEGDVVFNPKAAIDISGGHTTYEGGAIQTTSLVGANGQLYDIGTANPLLTYTGVVNPTLTQTYDKWGVSEVVPTPGLSHFESTYVQGASAGSVQFTAPSLVVDGTLKGSVVNGPYQRGPVGTSFGNAAAGGTLIIGIPGGLVTPDGTPDLLAPAIVLTRNPTPIVIADGSALPLQSLQLPTAYLTGDGFTSIQLFSNSGIALPAGQPLQLAPGASLSLTAPRIDVDSSIASIGGALSFTSVLTSGSATAPRLGVGVGEGVTLDVSGQWTNDDILADGIGMNPTLQNAGSIVVKSTATTSEVVLGDAVALKANGGAWLTGSGNITYGTGGAITLDASPAQSALQLGQGTTVQAFGAGTATGGGFSLSAPRIRISEGNGVDWSTAQRVDDLNPAGQVLNVYAPLFSNDGFSSISLTATGAVVPALNTDALSVVAGTHIFAQAQSLQLNAGYATIGSGGTLDPLAHTTLLPAYSRQPVSVSLNVLREADDASLGNTDFGNLDVQAGASIVADPGASIRLTSEGSVSIGGTLRALGGTISASIVSPGDVDPNSAGTSDPGYVPAQRIGLTPTALIDVSGAPIITPDAAGLLQGTVSSGGAVSLLANRGTVVAEAGSMIDIAGNSTSLDFANTAPLGGYTRSVVASSGGSLVVSSGQSISLLGQLNGAAGVGSNGAAAAGSLEIDLVRSDVAPPPGVPALPGNSLEIELVNSTKGATPTPADSDLAVLGVQQIAASGIDALTLRVGGSAATGNILIDAGQLALARSLVLDSPRITVASNASLSAPYIAMGNSQVEGQSATVPIPVGGDGVLNVSAQQLNLYGNFAFQGTAAVTLSSSGDLQLQGTDTNITGPITGKLLTSGNLTLNAARLYPDTYTDFTIATQGTGSTISIGQTSASPGTPLSAAGRLSVSADDILVAGTLFAPFGSIDLQANDTLTLASGSLLSVSGAGVDIPFGQTQLNGAQWVYQVPGGAANSITATPPKSVTLSAPNLSVQKGATVDVQGGGDLYSYEFVPGTGGSKDVLAQGTVAGLYAIIPSSGGAAPYDVQEAGTANQSQTVYLSGGAGITAGYYALLPARYAIEPGAVLIQLESGYESANGGQIGELANGTPVVAGYISSGTTGLHSGLTDYQGFAIYPSGSAQQLANYTISNASSYFAALAAMAGSGAVAEPADAGTFSLTVTQAANNALNLQGSVLTAAASGGRGAQINLSAPDLEVTPGTGGASPGSISVSGSVLQSWNAGSLTLGGVATPTAETATGIVVGANSVTIDGGVQLTADQIDLVALQSINVKSGATLESTSGAAGKVLSSLPAVNVLTLTDTGGIPASQAAFLSVSDLSLGVVSRPTVPTTTTAAAASLTLASGSSLSSGGALSFDAPGLMALSGTLGGKGANWSLGSSSISFEGGTASSDSLNIDSVLLASLQQAGSVRLASQSSIDIDSPLSLGVTAATPTLTSLTMIGNAINNLSGGNVSFGALSVTLGGNVAPDPLNPVTAADAGTGVLNLLANTFTVGPGVLSVNGFGQTTAQVAGVLQTHGSGYLNVGGNLTLNAVTLNPAPVTETAVAANAVSDATDGSGTTVLASGLLTIGAPTVSVAAGNLPTLVGGHLTLSGAAIEDAGSISAPSGIVALLTPGNLHLAASASIDTSGAALQAVDQSVASPGGIVMLNAGGNLSLDAGSAVSAAGSATAPAGSIAMIGAGTVNLAAALNGSSALTGGSLTIDAGQLTGGLMGLVNLPAGGGAGLASFSSSIDVRVHGGSLDLGAGNAIASNTLMLTADNGAIDIAGTLSAPSAAQRGSIVLSGGTAVTLENGGQLLANGSGLAGRGGEIDIDSICPTCFINLVNGSVVSAFGAAQMGELVLRAPATLSNDVAINVGVQGLGADVSRAGQVIIEPTLVFQETSGSIGGNLGVDVNIASGFLSAASPVIAARLNTASATPINVQTGIEIQDADATDALVLPSLNLAAFSTSGQVIDIAVRAAGALTLAGNISDGYVAGPIINSLALTNSPSATFSLVAGADLTSAGSTAVRAGSSAVLTLGGGDGGGAIVRTGTGNIDLAAAGNVVFNSGSSVYTAGTQASAPVTSKVGPTKSSISFASGGGNVLVSAGGDVVGSQVVGDNGNYSVTGWQPRVGNSKVPAQYGNDLAAFDWNLGALGGGDVTVLAAGQVNNLSAAVADSLASNAVSGTPVSTLFGAGGGLRIAATGDIGSAQLYVADGVGTVTTGGGLTAIVPNGNNTGNVGSSFALGNSQLSVWARQSIQVNAIYNPTAVSSQGFTNGQYFTYGTDSALSLSSTGGNVELNLNTDQSVMGALLGTAFIGQTGSNSGLTDLPASLSLRSLQQDVGLYAAGSILFPSPVGQLVLFAGRDIRSDEGEVAMSDSFAGSYPTASAPGVTLLNTGTSLGGLEPFAGNIHLDDAHPALITAGHDIVDLEVAIPKAAQIVAGLDVLNLTYQGQNTAAGDTTLISAGRDIEYNEQTTGQIQVGGPGSVNVFAGRNLNLGLSSGITTIGNLSNANLPSATGADLTLAVGYGTQGPDETGFLSTIIAPSATYQMQLIAFVEAQNGASGLSYAQAQTAFLALPASRQQTLIDSVFFNELLFSGRAANGGTNTGFAEGYAAIDALFPNSRTLTAANPYAGNLNLTLSQIYTLSGGNISIVVPGGGIDVGLAHAPSTLTSKLPSSLGIVAEGTGNVEIYSKGDVNVNASRIFTLGGGNILIWSDEGSIDAGNGSKSSLSVPPPVVQIAANGTITLDYGASLAAGSGIRTIQTGTGTTAGDVDLDAPVGTVNAGDAGIGSSGNINIAAAHVVGVDNINFGGTATGVPSDLSGLGASLSGVAAVAASATTNATSTAGESTSAKETAPLAQTALSWLDVFVTGLGEENCKQDDLECLKRQKSAVP